MGTSAVATSSLPPLYTPWIEEVLGGSVPEERHATCSACAMCKPTNRVAITASLTEFEPATKCCTYVPTLPNFLVGMVLEDKDPTALEGRASIEQRIARGIGVTPLGLQPGAQYVLVYKHASGELFGRTSGLRCPHYLPEAGGQCGIWRHRNAVCTTWFCKFERGRVGKRFWDAVLHLLTIVERQLSLWAASELGEPIATLGAALLPYYATVLTPVPDPWSQRWSGRATDFYRESARLVRPLSWTQVRAIGGPEVALLAGKLRAAYGIMQSREVPKYVRLGPVTHTHRMDGTCALTSYSSNDMLILPTSIAATLSRFDGQRPTDAVCAAIAEDPGVFVDRDTLLRLVDFGVLLAMPTPAVSAS